ncbi:hypothetical protein M9Y10_007949 [Tritrichomonas musculus]|uniref:Uncharacterized protein n=1 Tax=Tritrichomonas musculus TaxID=1915356 RepID=A0ABR2J4H1_9EUKA
MIKKRNLNTGVNANVSLEPTSAAQSNNNINNNIFINKRDDSQSEDIVITHEAVLTTKEPLNESSVKTLILETYAKILLNQDKALISNLISKHTIIVPHEYLVNIIKSVTGGDVEIYVDDNPGCCVAKVSPIQKIDSIKVVKESGEVVTDFKQVYNKEYNDLVNVYHLCLKYVVC